MAIVKPVNFGLVLLGAPVSLQTELNRLPADPGVTARTSGAPFVVTALVSGHREREFDPPPEPGELPPGGRPPRPIPGGGTWQEDGSSDGTTPVPLIAGGTLLISLSCACPPGAGALTSGTLILHPSNKPEIEVPLSAFLLALDIQYTGAYSLTVGEQVTVPVSLANQSGLALHFGAVGDVSQRLTASSAPFDLAPKASKTVNVQLAVAHTSVLGSDSLVLEFPLKLDDGTALVAAPGRNATVTIGLPFAFSYAGAYSLPVGGWVAVPVSLANQSRLALHVELGGVETDKITATMAPLDLPAGASANGDVRLVAAHDATLGSAPLVFDFVVTVPDGTTLSGRTLGQPGQLDIVPLTVDVDVDGTYRVERSGIVDVLAYCTNETMVPVSIRFDIALNAPDPRLSLKMVPQPLPPGARTTVTLPISAAPDSPTGTYPIELQYWLTPDGQPEQFGNTLDPTFTISVGEDPPAVKQRTVGLALGGGGALGSFQLGVLRFLYSRNIKPKIITGTSVGAINGVKLAEGEGTRADGYVKGLAGLEQVWFSLQTEDDMFVKELAYAAVPDDIESAIEQQVVKGTIFVGLFAAASLLYLALAGSSDVDKANAVLDLRGLNNLSPIEDRMRGRNRFDKHPSLDPDEVARSDIRLLIATVGLGSGALHYINNRGQMSTADAPDRPFAQVDLVEAVLASAAIPLFLSGRTLNGELHVDGGTREVVPIYATAAQGADEIYAILCSPGEGAEGEDQHKKLIKIVMRSVSLLVDEVVARSARPRSPLGWPFPVRLIAPETLVHGSREIDPGGIRINAMYGFLRGFDVVDRRLGPAARDFAAMRGRQIAEKRRDIWKLEQALASQWADFVLTAGVEGQTDRARYDALWLAANLQTLRTNKGELRALIDGRLAVAGPDSIQFTASWWTQWEAHKPGFAVGSMASPWDALTLDSGSGPPVVVESQAPTAPIPPSDADAERQFRVHKGASTPNGNFIQSDRGFELIVVQDGHANHYWRGDSADAPWYRAGELPAPAGMRFQSVAAFRVRSSADPAKYAELWAVARLQPASGDSVVATYRLASTSSPWGSATLVQVGGQTVTATGTPAMIQSDRGTPGNFELLVPQGNQLVHFSRDNGAQGFPWQRLQNVPLPPGAALLSVSFFESSQLTGDALNGTFKAVAHVQPPGGADVLVWIQLVAAGGAWSIESNAITVSGAPITGVTGRPMALQSDYGTANFELLVPQGNRLVHYFRDNLDPTRDVWGVAGWLTAPDATLSATSVAVFSSDLRADGRLGALMAVARWSGGGTEYVGTYRFGAIDPSRPIWEGPTRVVTGKMPLGTVTDF